MKILRHRLHHDDGTPVAFERSPNFSGRVAHEYLVMHYTAGSSAAGAIAALTEPGGNSAHLVIAGDGGITQLVAFDRVAWHAGESRWNGRVGLNRFSLGIEMDNAGRLERHGGEWRAWFGRAYDETEVVEAVHRHDDTACGWHLYASEQIAAAVEVSQLLVRRYRLRDVLGHDDIAPLRKRDPGPAFPMQSFRARVIGRRADVPPVYETTAKVNIRSGPGTQHGKLEGSPLPRGTRLELSTRQGAWCLVDVLDAPQGVMDLEGWVHGRFIRPLA